MLWTLFIVFCAAVVIVMTVRIVSRVLEIALLIALIALHVALLMIEVVLWTGLVSLEGVLWTVIAIGRQHPRLHQPNRTPPLPRITLTVRPARTLALPGPQEPHGEHPQDQPVILPMRGASDPP